MPVWTLHKFEALPSTNTYARELLSQGNASDGDLFQVAHQTAGRGRLGERVWLDEPGGSLLLSVVLCDVPRFFVELTPYVAALAMGGILRILIRQSNPAFTPERLRMKWPNDLLLDGKKCCGILSEAVWNGEELRGIVLGIGLNVNQTQFGEGLNDMATSLRVATGRILNIDELRDRFLSHLDELIERGKSTAAIEFKEMIFEDVREEFRWMEKIAPFQIEFVDGRKLSGITYSGISKDGALLGRDAAGKITSFYSGSINFQSGV